MKIDENKENTEVIIKPQAKSHVCPLIRELSTP